MNPQSKPQVKKVVGDPCQCRIGGVPTQVGDGGDVDDSHRVEALTHAQALRRGCLLYTSPSPRD